MIKFRKTYIEITNTCDRACGFCPGTTRPPQFMDLELFTTTLSRLTARTSLLHFHVMGEPLLHPQISLFLDKCADHDLRVNLVTNGNALLRRSSELLGKPALKQISISLQSIAESSSIDQYLRDLQTFITCAQSEPHLAISLRLWTFGNEDAAVGHRDLLNRLELLFNHTEPLYETVKKHHSARLGPRLYINCASQFQWPDLDQPDNGIHGTCLGLREQCAVLADGTVVPCCLDRNGIIRLGNIRESSLEDILSSDRAKRIIDGFRTGMIIEELCKKCTYRKRFYHEN